MTEGVSRQNALSTRIDGKTERIQAAHGRLEAMGAQLEHERGVQRTGVNELRESTRECQRQMSKLNERLDLSQVDTQRLDQGLSDLQENVFRNGVSIDRGLEERHRRIAQGLPSSSQQVSSKKPTKSMLEAQNMPWNNVGLSW